MELRTFMMELLNADFDLDTNGSNSEKMISLQ